MMSTRHFILSASVLAALSMSPQVHATSCDQPLYCNYTRVNLQTTELADGRWQYDYTFDLKVDDYSEYPVITLKSADYEFMSLRIGYFEDADVTNLKVGSDYAGQLTVSIEDAPLGHADKAIVVSAVAAPVTTRQPATVISGANTLLSFESAYAPTERGAADVTLYGPWYQRAVTFGTLNLWPDAGYSVHLNQNAIAIPGSPAAVPEPEAMALLLAGLATVAALSRHAGGRGRRAA